MGGRLTLRQSLKRKPPGGKSGATYRQDVHQATSALPSPLAS